MGLGQAWPRGQEIHRPLLENSPRAQGMGKVLLAQAYPAGHKVHAVWPGFEEVPDGHNRGAWNGDGQ